MKNFETQCDIMRFVYLEHRFDSCAGMGCSKGSNFHTLCA